MSEYGVCVQAGVTVETRKLLTEARIPFTGLTGTFVLGETVTETTSAETGVILWIEVSGTTGVLGLGDVSGAFTGGLTLTGGTSSATATGGTAQNWLERTADTPIYEPQYRTVEADLGYTPATATLYLDVKKARFLEVVNHDDANFLQLFVEATTNPPLTPWIPPNGSTGLIPCDHRLWKVIIKLSAASSPYSVHVFGDEAQLGDVRAR
jgi:hypothetical protein